MLNAVDLRSLTCRKVRLTTFFPEVNIAWVERMDWECEMLSTSIGSMIFIYRGFVDKRTVFDVTAAAQPPHDDPESADDDDDAKVEGELDSWSDEKRLGSYQPVSVSDEE